MLPPRFVRESRFARFSRIFPAIAALAALPFGASATPPGAVIANQATFEYENSVGQSEVLLSNEVSVVTAVIRTPAAIEFTRVLPAGGGDYREPVGPSACLSGGAYQTLGNPVLSGGLSIDPDATHDVSPATVYNLGEPFFIRLADNDQNLDYEVRETVDVQVGNAVSGDSETLRLSETGLNTGIFVGYIPTARASVVAGDCVLQGTLDSEVSVNYVDPADSGDTARTGASLDPVGVVFKSDTGEPVDGVRVEIVDSATGLPAPVFGNDGVSVFPSQLVSGTTVTDSSGTAYVFGDGEFRFPVVPAGSYRLEVTPPQNFVAPSEVSIAELQSLPGAPYALGPASFGAEFVQNAPVPADIDVPIDPTDTAMFLRKQTQTTTAAPGDFVRYELTLENSGTTGAASLVRIVDRLPPAARFVKGTVTVDGSAAPDPDVSADLRTLEFRLADLPAGARVRVTYVVEIVDGMRGTEIVNSATAFAAGGEASNQSKAAIRLTEDLFRSSGTIIGRIVDGDCGHTTYSEEAGVAGVRVYLEDGRYAVSDAGGRFHLEGIDAGTHVAQMDTFTVPDYFDILGCDRSPGFSGSESAQFVRVAPGGLHRADFYLRRKPAPDGHVDLELQHFVTATPDEIAYRLTLSTEGDVALTNVQPMIVLPEGASYVPDSLAIDGVSGHEATLTGPAVTVAIEDLRGNRTRNIEFRARLDTRATGDLVSRAMVRFDSPVQQGQRTPVAETRIFRQQETRQTDRYVLNLKFPVLSDALSPHDKRVLDRLAADWAEMDGLRIAAVGHSDSQRIGAGSQSGFTDNYDLSRARAQAAGAYLANAFGIAVSAVSVEGRGPDEPVAGNDSAEGRARNRRVEIELSGIAPSAPAVIEVTQASSGRIEVATQGTVPGQEADSAQIAEAVEAEIIAGTPKAQVEPLLETLHPGIGMLLPEQEFQPAIPATKVSVQHRPGQTVALSINGRPASPLNFDATVVNRNGTVAVSRWRTAALDDGDNVLLAVITNADGTPAETLRRTIRFTGTPIRGVIDLEASNLVADGKTRPVIAIRLYDRAGNVSRPGMVGGYRVNPPYRSWWDVEKERENALVAIGERQSTYRVGTNGLALIELEPTTRTGEVTLDLKFADNREQEIRGWLRPAPRDWILVGFAEGTAANRTIADNATAAAAAGEVDGYYDDGRVAFFAKGQIRGEYLLTLAYDSDRRREDNRARFETVVDPNAYYPLYADQSEQRFEAASQRNLYVKLERNQFYALFGDLDTGLSVTDLARYQRRFNGFKSEYRGEHVGYSAFAAESDQGFVRDELRGDGTSGLYTLSRAPIIANSDDIRIEVRDRFDTGRVISTSTLSRYLDYNIDNLNGTLYFRKPVQSRDLDFNPVFIVAEYETVSDGGDDIIAGGRVSVRSAGDNLEIGATYINDRTQGAEAELSGVDLRWQINDQTLLRAEVASTNSEESAGSGSATGSFIDLEHNGENIDVRAYIREVDENFGVGYQSAADRGARRLGVDARAKVTEHVFVEGEAAWQQMLETEDIRNVVRGRVRYEKNSLTASLGLTHAEDKFDDGDARTSDLAELSLSKKVLNNTVTLRASASTALGSDAENLDYPTGFVLGADYRLMQGVDLIAEYEDSSGRYIDTKMSRIGVRAAPWSRAQINTSLTQEETEFGPRLFANLGLVQGFQLSERWLLDIGLDQTETLADADARAFDPDRELASGSYNADFVSAYTGALYTSDTWSANGRLEVRDSDGEDRITLLFGWYRASTEGHGLSAGLTVFNSRFANDNELTSANLKLGWAYRKAGRRWSFLDRADLVFDDSVASGSSERSWRLINNFNAHWRVSAATRLSLQYAFKYVRSNFDDLSLTGYSDLIGVDFRRGFRDRWDAGIGASVYHSYNSRVLDYSVGADIAYNVGKNMWLTLGYNVTGFDDKDFAQARYTSSGPFLRFTVKADQHTLKRIAGR